MQADAAAHLLGSDADAARRSIDVIRDASRSVLQEALTNAHEHGTGTAELALTGDTDNRGLHVTNPIPDGVLTSQPGGHCLIGMRERVSAVGGSLTAGSDTDGGFTVDLRLPKVSP